MSVVVRYFDDQTLGSFMEDFESSFDAAIAAGDQQAKLRLRSLWLDYLEIDLASMTASQFDAYLAVRRPTWRQEGSWQILKTPDQPCIAFTSQINLAGVVSVHALGAVYRYPNSDEHAWWTDIIRPRVRSFGP